MTALLAITNATAGSADDEAVEAALGVLRDGAVVSVARTDSSHDLDAALADRGERRPVIVGGDGSLHLVVQRLLDRGELAECLLGLVPLGTGNDLARAVGIPLDPVQAAHIVLDGAPRRRDLLVDDQGGVVVNAVHVGIGAEAARKAESLKDRLGMAAYTIGSLVAGSREPGWRLRVEVDGEVLVDVDRRVLMVGLGLGTSIGGGTKFTPDAVPDDGFVEVVVSESTGPAARIGYAVRLKRGTHGDRPDVLTTRGTSVTVSGQGFPFNADGEVGGPVDRRAWTVRRGGWALTVPATNR